MKRKLVTTYNSSLYIFKKNHIFNKFEEINSLPSQKNLSIQLIDLTIDQISIKKSSPFRIGKKLLYILFIVLLYFCTDFASAQECFGKSFDDPDVCSSVGSCISENLCVCNSGYGGQICEKFRCGDKNQDESGVCSGKGTCSGPNTCTCSDTTSWGGSLCHLPVCDGILADSLTVCSGAGNCTAPGICSCTNDYPHNSFGNTGTYCEDRYCGNVPALDPLVCSSRGACTFNTSTLINDCICNTGYTNGPSNVCELNVCFGKRSDSPSVCGGISGAVCSSPDICTCPSGYGGSECQDIYCGAYLATDPLVCSSKGTCTGPNNCECQLGYKSGSNPSLCNIKTCDGKVIDDINICNGHGTCNPTDSTPDQCLCASGYSGNYCEEWTCSGISRNDPDVCSGYGTCIDVDTCYYSNCFGKSASDNTVCSNRQGRCIETDVCYCDPAKYQGTQCEYPVCYGILSTNSSACSGHGTCEYHDNCYCPNENYIGLECEVTKCNSISSNIEDVCGGHGTCWPQDTCTCNEKWLKSSTYNCNIPTCFGISATNSNVCNGRGNCIDIDTCQCTSVDRKGEQCEVEKCISREKTCSGHGDCDSNHDNCVCDSGWIGTNCTDYTCYGKEVNDSSVCNGKGNCTYLNQCECFSWEWTGAQCTLPGCYGKSNQDPTVCSSSGLCVGLNDCDCFSFVSGYKNYKCENPGCFGAGDTNICSNHGECVEPDTCVCESGYNGYNCQYHSCFEISSGNSSVCSGRGICSSMNTCTCNSGYTGDQCQYTTCYSIPGSSHVSCSGHGDCISPDPNPKCNCTDTTKWNGEVCQLPVCFGTIANDPSVCSGRGECVSYQDCVCTDPYSSGEQCEIWICDNILANDSSVCFGHGACDKPNFCTCQDGYDPPFCEHHFCYNILNIDANVCSGHGVCSNVDSCTCDPTWSGNQCEYYTCGSPLPEEILCHYQGACVNETTCVCNSEYYGKKCDIHMAECVDPVLSSLHSIADNCSKCLDNSNNCISYIGNFTLSLVDIVGIYKVPNRAINFINCSDIIASPGLELLGTNPICHWASLTNNLFSIVLGEEHTVTSNIHISFQMLPFSSEASFWSSSINIIMQEEIIIPYGPSIVYPYRRIPNLTWFYILAGAILAVIAFCCLFCCSICILFSIYYCSKMWLYSVNVKSIEIDSNPDEENALLNTLNNYNNKSNTHTSIQKEVKKEPNALWKSNPFKSPNPEENSTPRGLNSYFSDPKRLNDDSLAFIHSHSPQTPHSPHTPQTTGLIGEDLLQSEFPPNNELYRIINEEKRNLRSMSSQSNYLNSTSDTSKLPTNSFLKNAKNNFVWNEETNGFVPAINHPSLLDNDSFVEENDLSNMDEFSLRLKLGTPDSIQELQEKIRVSSLESQSSRAQSREQIRTESNNQIREQNISQSHQPSREQSRSQSVNENLQLNYSGTSLENVRITSQQDEVKTPSKARSRPQSKLENEFNAFNDFSTLNIVDEVEDRINNDNQSEKSSINSEGAIPFNFLLDSYDSKAKKNDKQNTFDLLSEDGFSSEF